MGDVGRKRWGGVAVGSAVAFTALAACANLDGLSGGAGASPLPPPEAGSETGSQTETGAPDAGRDSDAATIPTVQSPLRIDAANLVFPFKCSDGTFPNVIGKQ